MPEHIDLDPLRELEKENEKLRAEVEKLREQTSRGARLQARFAGFATSSSVRVLLSPDLVTSIKAWLEARSLRNPAPTEQTAEMLAAMFRRVVRVGLFGVLAVVVAAVAGAASMGLTTWQNFLLREQNAKIQSQIDQQASDNLIARRSQLLNTIYEEVCEGVPVEFEANEVEDAPSRGCKPRAHIRARQEAVLALLKIENLQGTAADLAGAKLDIIDATVALQDRATPAMIDVNLRGVIGLNPRGGTDLSGANLGHANLIRANLRRANLFEVILIRAILVDANLTRAILVDANLAFANLAFANLAGAHLGRANLTGANLGRANLSGAKLVRAKLNDAYLTGANLAGADLTGADLSQGQVNNANGDENTKLPEGLTMPKHWKTEEVDPADR